MRLAVKRNKCPICYICVSEFANKRGNVCKETNYLCAEMSVIDFSSVPCETWCYLCVLVCYLMVEKRLLLN